MFTKRVIPCLDVNGGRVVKGVNFVNLRDAGDPVEIAAAYDKAGADELVFLDITATSDARNTVVDMVRRVAERVFIPFTVGGGIRTVDDFTTPSTTTTLPCTRSASTTAGARLSRTQSCASAPTQPPQYRKISLPYSY